MTAEEYLAALFESDGLDDEEFHRRFPAYGEWDAGLPGLEIHWNPLSWVWRLRNDPPAWMVARRDDWNETLQFLQRLHDKYRSALPRTEKRGDE